MTLRNRWRKILSSVMLSLTGVCALIAVSALFLILGYLIYDGWRSVDWNFFTKLPKPPGETGGGMANAIVGSIQIVALASVIGLPIGFLAGVYLSEFGGKTFSFLVRYMADLLNGVPSIVIGIFAWTVVVVTMGNFSVVAGHHPDSDHRALDRAIPEHRAPNLARGSPGVGSEQVENHCQRGSARGLPGNRHWHDSGGGPHLG
jgi:ABC-type phosphate transport system permease subunit